MEGTCPSETSVDFLRTTRRYIPEDKSTEVRTEAEVASKRKGLHLWTGEHSFTPVISLNDFRRNEDSAAPGGDVSSFPHGAPEAASGARCGVSSGPGRR
jgi:hypothetical protein